MIHELGLTELSALVTASEMPVLVDFHADWCGPCQQRTPVLESLKQELGASLNIVKVNVDREQELARAFQVRTDPALLLFKNGILQKRFTGLTDSRSIKTALAGMELIS